MIEFYVIILVNFPLASTIVTFMFHSFYFQLSGKVSVLISLSLFSVLPCGSLFLLTNTRSGRRTEIWLMIRLYFKIPQNFVCLIFQDGFWVAYISFVRMVKFKLLHNSQWITLSTQSCLVLWSLCANLLHSLIMWLIVSSLSQHSLHLLFCCVLSILAFDFLMALFCAVIRRDSVSFLRFPFRSHFQVFSCEISVVFCLKRLYFCFFSYFCFLVIFVLLLLVVSVLFLVDVISFLPCFLMLSSCRYISASTLSWMLASSLHPSFLDTYNLSTSSLERPYVSQWVFLGLLLLLFFL